MDTDIYIPPSFKNLPPIASETADKFRWPPSQPRRSCLPIRSKISVDGLQQSPPHKPRLRYHRQSSYSDAFIKQTLLPTEIPSHESTWINAPGKHGEFLGVSSYENDFDWPKMLSKMERLPLVSTIGMGILPIMGKSDEREADKMEESITKDRVDESLVEVKKKDKISLRGPDHSALIEYQNLWPASNTHRIDYLIPPKGFKTKIADEPKATLTFWGTMETSTTSMRDYQNPRNMISGYCHNCTEEDK